MTTPDGGTQRCAQAPISTQRPPSVYSHSLIAAALIVFFFAAFALAVLYSVLTWEPPLNPDEQRYALRNPDCATEASNAVIGDLWDCYSHREGL